MKQWQTNRIKTKTQARRRPHPIILIAPVEHPRSLVAVVRSIMILA
jgi:hypothetical protein